MTLKSKLHSVYEILIAIEKGGHNSGQNYDYVRAADVTNAIRKQLATAKVYAEINFEFIGAPYTIARSKDKDAPFSAVNVRCSIVFHDLESEQTLTSSGLGSGADGGDKAAYKAQTGALKYALKNAFLVPDEADPEADEALNNAPSNRPAEPLEQPEFRDVPRTAPRPAASRPTAPAAPQAAGTVTAAQPTSQPAPSTDTQLSFGAPAADAPSSTETAQDAAPEHGDAYEGPDDNGAMPTEVEMEGYRTRFVTLANELSAKGKLTASKGLKLNDKLRVFLIRTEGVDTPIQLTKAQWDDFFNRANVAVNNPEIGLLGLAKLINKANGIESKQ